jgi:hypothetical protein
MTDEYQLDTTGSDRRQSSRSGELATVRLTVSVTFNLNGELPNVARGTLIRMVDRAIVSNLLPGEGDVRVVEREFERAEVTVSPSSGFPGTDFSQLLDLRGWACNAGPLSLWALPSRRQTTNRRCAISSKPSNIRLSTSSTGTDMLGAIFHAAPPVITHFGSSPQCARKCSTMRCTAPAMA